MPEELETILKWEIKIPFNESKKLIESIAGTLVKTGFIKKDEYWENEEIGALRFYSEMERRNSESRLYIWLKTSQIINGLPPVISIIEQVIYRQRWTSLITERNPKYI